MGQWAGQVCVITGAASGIGAGLARHSASLGMHVIAADVDESGLRDLERQARMAEQSLITMKVDVTDEQAVEKLAAFAFDRYGRVNLLFNNAGVLVDGKSWERPLDSWRWSFDVNVMGVIYGIHSFVPRMLRQGEPGRVINTSSIGGLMGGGAFMGPYQSTKHAVTALTETLFRELAQEPAVITASVLCPAEVATGIWESDRLRPDVEPNKLATQAEREFHDLVAGGVAAGLSPDEFALKVFEDIEAGKFWIIPDTGFMPVFEQRSSSIIDRTDPSTVAITSSHDRIGSEA